MPADGVPRLVQSVMPNNTWGTRVNLATDVHVPELNIYLPQPSLPNNCILVPIAGWRQDLVGAPTITFSDNLGSSGWTKLVEQTDATNGYYAALWALPNCGAGVKKITATFAQDGFFVAHEVSEWCNIATSSILDGSNHAAGAASTAMQAGSITPATSGALIFHFAVTDSNNTEVFSFTKDTGFTLLGVDPWFGTACQYKVHTSGAINPTLTSSATDPYISLVVGLKAAVAGTAAPTGQPWVSQVQWRDLLDGTGSSSSKTYDVQAPFALGANTLAILYTGAGQTLGTSPVITGVTDSKGNTWVVKTASFFPDNTAASQVAYALNATADDSLVIHVTFNQTDTESSIVFYAITGQPLSFDKVVSFNGTQTVTAPAGTLSIGTITPSTGRGLALCVTGIALGALHEPTDTTTWFGQHPWSSFEDGGGDRLRQDNGWTHAFVTSRTPLPLTYHHTRESGVGVAGWAAQAIVFSAPEYPPRKPLSHQQRRAA